MIDSSDSEAIWMSRITDYSADYLIHPVITGGLYPSIGLSFAGVDLYQGSEDVMK